MITSLLWKEWRECRWKMLALFAVYLPVLLAWAWQFRSPMHPAQIAILALTFIIPAIVAMSTIADEHVRRTSETFQVLPIAPGRVFLVKTLAGLATVLLPLLAVEIFSFLVLNRLSRQTNDVHNDLVMALSAAGTSVTLYLWTLALAARRRTELGVGITYVLMFAGLAIAVVLSEMCYEALCHVHEIGYYAYWRVVGTLSAFGPVGFLIDPEASDPNRHLPWATIAIFQAATWPPLWAIALWRHTHVDTARTARFLARAAAIAPSPLSPRHLPVLWKSWRESRLLVLSCLCVNLAVITLFGLHIHGALSTGKYLGAFVDFLVVLPGFLSMVIVILLGVDVGMREAEPHIENFWHSRAIPQAHYFRQRFAFGLLCSLLVLILPALVTLSITAWLLAATPAPPPELLNLSGRVGMGPPMTLPADWPQWKSPGAIQEMLSNLQRTREAAVTFLGQYVLQTVLFFAFSAFIATLSRRRIIPLIASFGFAIAFQMFYIDEKTRILLEYWASGGYVSWLPLAAYCAIMLALAAAFALLALKSTTAHWRARLERRLDDHAPVPATT